MMAQSPEFRVEDLMEEARRARVNAYAPYSDFSVGAALLCDDGQVFTGANIENSSYSMTICAERVALFSAVKEGKRKFKAIAVAASTGESAYPCGACRQVLAEFSGAGPAAAMDAGGATGAEDLIVLVEQGDGIEQYALSDLLVKPFLLGPKEKT